MSARKDLESVYPLSPMQQGMLFHTLYAPGSGVYVEQLHCILEGSLDAAAFRQAWQRALDRHTVLRTAFVWKRLENARQVVHRHLEVPLEWEDWSGLEAAEQDHRLEAMLASERLRGFDLNKAPLVRLKLIRLGENTHRFVWSHHHLLLDGWSLPILLKEVFACYEAAAAGRTPVLPPARPYREYIDWLRRQDRSRAQAFWRRYLKGFAAPTPLAAGPEPSAAPDLTTYATEEIQLPAECTSELQALCRQNGLTLNTLVQGAWALLLSRYSGESDVLFGATVSGRPAELAGAGSMLGLFINTLPVRARIPDGMAMLDWLRQLQVEQAELRQYEHSSLAEVQSWSEIPRGVSLFDSLLVFENYPVDDSLLSGTGSIRVRGIRSLEQTNYPLTLVSGPGRVLALKAAFDTRRFERSRVIRMLGHLRVLLESVAADPRRRLCELSPVPPEERRLLTVEWARNPADFDTARTAPELFEEQVRLRPAACAVAAGERRLTYAELNRRVNRMARYLRKRGVRPESVVAIWMERSVEMIVAALAVVKAGGAYLPLDPDYPRDRIEYMLADSRAEFVLTSDALARRMSAPGPAVIRCDTELDAIAAEEESDPQPLARPGNLAYIIYTSGSTGRPKGTLLQHGGLANFVRAFSRTTGIGPGTRVLQFASFSFDASVGELFTALCCGAEMHLAESGDVRSGPALLRLIRDGGITHATLPPSLLRVLPPESVPGLQTLFSVGEPCPPDVSERWSQGRALFNGYGPTEATVGATCHRLTGGPPLIGKPFANVEVYVLDRRLEAAAVGVPGELCIGGAGLARGYLGRPELTAEKFIPHPFSGEPGARLYRSGDRARWTEGGELEYLGRLDEQVKVRGFRIELGEIEAVLRQAPGVGEAVVVAREEEGGERRLVAYVVGETEGLREWVKGRLPGYMLPSAWVGMEKLPLLPNGKVNRGGLPAPEAVGERSSGGAARTPVEAMLVEIWEQVLKRGGIGIHDNFFELGGHSLLATRLLGRLGEPFGVEVGLRELFERPTVAELGALIEERMRGGKGWGLPPIEASGEMGPLPLSYAQQRLWFLDQLAPGNAFYNNPAVVRVRGRLEVGRLAGALEGLIERHAILRTRFEAVGGRPVQVVGPGWKVELGVEEVSGEEEARGLAREEAGRPFDLGRGPLLRVRLLRLGEEEHLLLLTLHHIVADGWSLGILVRELGVLYGGGRLEPLRLQYGDYAVWQRKHLAGEVLERQLKWWREQLAGAPAVLELPADRARPAVQSFRGGHYRFRLGEGLEGGLEELKRREGVTLFMVLLGVYQVLLARYTGEEDISVGTVVANRGRGEVEGLLGFFVNTLVLRTQLGGDPTFREVLGRVREVCLGAYAHQEAPFEGLVEVLAPERDLSHAPLFQVMLVVNQGQREGLEVGGLRLEGVETESGTSRFDLTWEVGEGEGVLWGSLEYAADLFEEGTVARMAGHLGRLLEEAVSHPERRISELGMLGREERERVLVEWNRTAAEYPSEATVDGLVREQAERDPGRVAVRLGGREVRYGELEGEAEARARELPGGSLVAISLERSIEQVVWQLAVLKAGSAFVPVDPGYPGERVRYMLEDSGAGVVIDGEGVHWRRSGLGGRQAAGPESLAYVIYTSGSTGRPKGTLLRHRGLCNLVKWQGEVFGIGAGSRVLQFAPSSFDASVWETYMALGNGGCLCLGRQEEMGSMEGLHGLLRREGVTVVTLPPSVLGLLEAEGLEELQVVIAAGEACSRELVRKWGEGRKFYNAYGPTEATVCASAYLCDAREERGPAIGRGIWNTQLYILDRWGQPAPVGVVGELHIGGVGLAVGYLNREELTGEKFVENRFRRGERMYRTGDLARWRGDGQVEYVGRVDGQVKLRGYRIELGEVEEVLKQQAGVVDAAAAVRGDKLVGYVVGEAGVQELRGRLRERLPEYLVPQVVVKLEGMPRLPNGKVDRKGLPEWEGVRGELGREYVAPRTEVEGRLAGLCGELLGVERVGVEDSFFELGGHSLLATQLLSRVREGFGVELALRAIFEAPTIAGLAARIEEARARQKGELEEIAGLLAQVDGLSEEEVKTILQGKELTFRAAAGK